MSKFIKLFIVAAALLILGGCSTINRAIQWGAAANDEAVIGAREVKCKIATVGSIRREYNTPDLIRAYNLECGKTLAED